MRREAKLELWSAQHVRNGATKLDNSSLSLSTTPHQSLLFISSSQNSSQYSLYIKITITIKSNFTWGTVIGFSLFF